MSNHRRKRLALLDMREVDVVAVNNAIRETYHMLPDRERAQLDSARELLRDEVRQRGAGRHVFGLGDAATLEVVAKLGMWLAAREGAGELP